MKQKPAASKLVGRKIIAIRPMTDEERQMMMWDYCPVVIELDDHTLIWPQRDEEGNDGGALSGQSPEGKSLAFFSSSDGKHALYVED